MGTTETTLLKALLERAPDWVSGGDLAERLDVSRVAVWQHVKKLRAQGFALESDRRRGYRLAAHPSGLHAGLIELQLKVRPRGFALLFHDEIDSTNDEAARQLAAGRPAPFAVLARTQTRGRGRFGRKWHSQSQGNLYASFAFRPWMRPDRMQTFTLWMGLNVCELVANVTRVDPGLKWPNDIVFEGRKAGGMLTEARVDADQVRDLVFGLGLNVNGEPAEWPSELAPRVATLSEAAKAPLDLNRVTAALIGRVLLAYERFASGDHLRSFTELWRRFDVLTGRKVAVIEGNRRQEGTAVGVDDEGALLLRDEGGQTHRFRAGEVSLDKGWPLPHPAKAP